MVSFRVLVCLVALWAGPGPGAGPGLSVAVSLMAVPNAMPGAAKEGPLLATLIREMVNDTQSRAQGHCAPGRLFTSPQVLKECEVYRTGSDRSRVEMDGFGLRSIFCEKYSEVTRELCQGPRDFEEPAADALDEIVGSDLANVDTMCSALGSPPYEVVSPDACRTLCDDPVSVLPLCPVLLWSQLQLTRVSSNEEHKKLLNESFPGLYRVLMKLEDQRSKSALVPKEVRVDDKKTSTAASAPVIPNNVQFSEGRSAVVALESKQTEKVVSSSTASIKPENPPVVSSNLENPAVSPIESVEKTSKEAKVTNQIPPVQEKKEEVKVSQIEKSPEVKNVDPNEQNMPLEDGDDDPVGDSVDYTTSGRFMEAEDSHFMEYFLLMCGMTIVCYVVFHNKNKIIGLIVEGRKSNRRRRGGPAYQKLNHTLEEAVNSAPPSHNPNIVY